MSDNAFHMKVNNSALELWRICNRRAQYRYILGFDAAAGDAADFGSAIHAGLRSWHGAVGREKDRHMDPEACLSHPDPKACIECEAVAAFREVAKTGECANIEQGLRRSINHGERLLREYFRHYEHNPFRNLSPLLLASGDPGLEVKLAAKINPWITYEGTCDGAVALSDGRPAAFEHKTTWRIDREFQSAIKPNHQLTGYIWLLREHGLKDCSTAIWNGLSTEIGKLDKGDTNALFVRMETTRTDAEIEEWKSGVIATCEEMRRALERNFFPMNASRPSCFMYHKECPYMDVCNIAATERMRLLEGSYRYSPWKSFEITPQKGAIPSS